jgi:uncharacterized membrane protein
MIGTLKTTPERVSAALLIAVFVVCVYRAATQSIVHDEALTYQIYLAGPAANLFNYFDANHHFLNTVLMRVTTSLFGFSVLAMRIPALIGAALLLTALYRFCRWMLGNGWILPLALAAVSLNPFLMDFMVAARGYGLALGLWMWALALLAPEIEKAQHDRKNVAMAGAAAALSVTANLVFAMPVLVLAAMVIWFSIANRKPAAAPAKKREAAKKPAAMWLDFFAPAAAIAIAFLLMAPLENAQGGQFYVGAATIAESLRSMAEPSIDHSGPSAYESFAAHLIDLFAFGFGPLVILAGAVAGLKLRNLALLLTSIPALGSALLLLALHSIRDMPYPENRTGIYFVAAVMLIVVAFASLPIGGVRTASMVLLAFMTISFLVQFEPRMFWVWRYDAESSQIATQLAEIAKTKQPLNVFNSWQLEPALNFYRETAHLSRLAQFTRPKIGPGYDVYVLTEQDRGAVKDLALTISYKGPVSGTVIAVGAH